MKTVNQILINHRRRMAQITAASFLPKDQRMQEVQRIMQEMGDEIDSEIIDLIINPPAVRHDAVIKEAKRRMEDALCNPPLVLPNAV